MRTRSVEGPGWRNIEGLRMFMTTAEKNRLEMMNPPDETPQLFETLLPYAYALDAAETWANRFEKVLAAAHYTPSWYRGDDVHVHDGGRDRGVHLRNVERRSTGTRSSGSGGSGSSGGGGGGGGDAVRGALVSKMPRRGHLFSMCARTDFSPDGRFAVSYSPV